MQNTFYDTRKMTCSTNTSNNNKWNKWIRKYALTSKQNAVLQHCKHFEQQQKRKWEEKIGEMEKIICNCLKWEPLFDTSTHPRVVFMKRKATHKKCACLIRSHLQRFQHHQHYRLYPCVMCATLLSSHTQSQANAIQNWNRWYAYAYYTINNILCVSFRF